MGAVWWGRQGRISLQVLLSILGLQIPAGLPGALLLELPHPAVPCELQECPDLGQIWERTSKGVPLKSRFKQPLPQPVWENISA